MIKLWPPWPFIKARFEQPQFDFTPRSPEDMERDMLSNIEADRLCDSYIIRTPTRTVPSTSAFTDDELRQIYYNQIPESL